MFEKPRHVSHADSDNPLAVHLIFLCSESRRLCVAGAMGQVMLFKFRKTETTSEVLVLEIPILYENFDDIYGTSPECDFLTGHQVQKTESSDSDKVSHVSSLVPMWGSHFVEMSMVKPTICQGMSSILTLLRHMFSKWLLSGIIYITVCNRFTLYPLRRRSARLRCVLVLSASRRAFNPNWSASLRAQIVAPYRLPRCASTQAMACK